MTRFLKRLRTTGSALAVAALLGASPALLPVNAWAGQALISDHQEMYPRAVLIAHNGDATRNGDIIVSATSFDGGAGHEDIFVSHDHGATFTAQGAVSDTIFSKGLCCGGLYELPTAIGALPAGTLLWAGSVGGDTNTDPMQIRIYSSADEGAHWSYLSNCATASVPRSGGGLWEPDFAIAGDGRLMCYYSDETRAGHSQILTEVATGDGLTWTNVGDLAISSVPGDRPGMANVVRLPGGSYVASFEICGAPNCAAYLKTSADGINWGTAGTLGNAVALADGTTFWHTPTLAWSPVPGQAHGQLLMQGQVLTKSGVVQTGNGGTLFYNSAGDGTGGWLSLAAPVKTAMPAGTAGNYCQNYSSPLLPLGDGRTALSLASDFSGTVCKVWFNVAPLSGAALSGGNISLNGTTQTGGDFTVTAQGSLGDSFNLSVTAPGAPATLNLSQSQVTLAANGTASVHVTVTPTAVASANTSHPLGGMGGGGGIALAALGLAAAARFKPKATLLAASTVLLSGCGGGSGGGGSTSSAPTPTTTNYAATLHAVSVNNPAITADVNFTIAVTR